jgi:integrase
MPNITYYSLPKKINKDGKIPIVANVTVNGKNTWKTMMWIKEGDWDPKPGKEKWIKPGRTGSKDYIENKRKNELLKTYKERIEKYFEQCTLDNVKVTPQLVKAYFNGVNPEDVSVNNFWDIYEKFLNSRTDMKANTLRGDNTTRNLLKAFEKSTGYIMTFDSVNLMFFDELETWMLTTNKKGWNYFAANIKRLKTYMKWAKTRGYHNNMAYQDEEFSAPEEKGTIIYLTRDELQKLYNFQFEDPKYSRVRDIFCFGCFTGLRQSDLYSLTRDHIQGNFFVKHAKKKSEDEALYIPLVPQAKTIIERYSTTYRALPKLSQQKLNDWIKDAAELAGIKEPFLYKDFTGGPATEKVAHKHELISSHIARKTFICMAFEQGVDIETIKKITGIKQEKTLARYLHITRKTTENAVNKIFEGI